MSPWRRVSGAWEADAPDAVTMRTLGQQLATLLRAGDLVILDGPLGAGKTTFTQGIAEGLGVRGPITSPTFVIARRHPQPAWTDGPALVHVDAYRLADAGEVEDLDLDADSADAVTVVEWGVGKAEGLAPDRLVVAIERATGVEADPSGGGSGAREPAGTDAAPADSAPVDVVAHRTSAERVSTVLAPPGPPEGPEGRRVRLTGIGVRWADLDLADTG